MNRALFASHCYLSWGFVWPYIMALVHVMVALRAPYSEIVKDASNSSCGQCMPFPLRSIKAVGYLFLVLTNARSSPCGLSSDFFVCSGLKLVCCLLICTLTELVSMWNLTKVEIQLCNMLSPEGPKVSLGSYNWGLVSFPFNAPTYLLFSYLAFPIIMICNFVLVELSILGLHSCVGRQLSLPYICIQVSFFPINQLVWYQVPPERWENKQGTQHIMYIFPLMTNHFLCNLLRNPPGKLSSVWVLYN